MDSVLPAALEGFFLVFSWPNILYPIIGTLLAMVVSAIPGVSGVTLMAIAIPFTLAWDPLPAVLLFGALTGGATFMGSVSSILFNIPGKNSNAATLLDGHPMAQQGHAKTAIGCSAAASALGSTFGVIVLIALIPVMREAVLAFGPPELLILVIWGLATISMVHQGGGRRGLILAGVGFLISFIGYDSRTAELRYTFSLPFLRDGLGLVPIFLGMFAVSEVFSLMVSGRQSLSGSRNVSQLQGSVGAGVAAVFQNFGLFLRSSMIGTLIGAIPGVGATVASFVAYGHAAQTAGPDSRFGHGDIRGVLAPEAANDAKDGGAMIPTLAFGIPGGIGTAMLLAALTLHGLTPGRELMTSNLPLVFALIWSLFLSNWLTSLIGLTVVGPMARITVVRIQFIVPLILSLAMLGAYIYRGRVSDVAVAFGFGVFGFYLRMHDWPRVPFVIALVLGPLFEAYFHLTYRLHQLGRIDWAQRPVSIALLVLTLLAFALPVIRKWRASKVSAP